MTIDQIVVYVVGYVDDLSREVVLMTKDQEYAVEWTGANPRYGAIAVFRGLYQDDLDCGTVDHAYIADHLTEPHEVCGYNGVYTNEYLAQAGLQ